jgi:hypothetical protein
MVEYAKDFYTFIPKGSCHLIMATATCMLVQLIERNARHIDSPLERARMKRKLSQHLIPYGTVKQHQVRTNHYRMKRIVSADLTYQAC